MSFLSRVQGDVEASGIVTFTNGQHGRVPHDQPALAELLRTAASEQMLVAASIDAAGVISAVVPFLGFVRGITEDADGLHLVMDTHARPMLIDRQRPDFSIVATTLRSAGARGVPVAVSTDHDSARDIFEVASGDLSGVSSESANVIRPPILTVSTDAQLKAGLAACLREGCREDGSSPQGVRVCLAFPYPDLGCNERAHRMAALLRAKDVSCGKVWLFMNPSAHVRIPHRRDCFVDWPTHVAVLVRTAAGEAVIDPALSRTILMLDEWRAMISTKARLERSDARVFSLTPGRDGRWDIGFDDDFNMTTNGLGDAIEKLKALRAELPDYCRLE